MKLLFENWRKYVTERVDYPVAGWPKRKPTKSPFEKITIKDIVGNPSELRAEKLALLERLDDLMLETEPKKIKHILKALFKFSGYSSDFDFETKEEARNTFLTPQHQLPYAADHEIQSLKNIFDSMKKTSPVFSYPPKKNI